MAKQVYWLSEAEWKRIEPLLPRGRKRGAFNNAIGRSRGGQTTKIHALNAFTPDGSSPF